MDSVTSPKCAPDPNLKIHVKDIMVPKDPAYVQVGPVDLKCAMFAPALYDTNMRVAGMVKRIGGALPYVQNSKFADLNRFVIDVAIPFLFPDPQFRLKSIGEYLEGRPFTLNKTENWKRFHDDHMGKLGRCEKREQYVATHTKLEFYSEPKLYRGIYARSDRFKASYGPLISSIEDVVYKLKYFIKSIPVINRPKFIYEMFGEDLVYTNDHSAFESSNNPELMNAILRPIYLHIASEYGDLVDDYMDALTARQIIKARDYVANTRGRRMSGEMDTSLGNGLVNLLTIMYVMHLHGLTLEEMIIIIEGDDSLFKKLGKNITADDFKSLGFNAKLECVGACYESSFCGMVFSPDDFVCIADPIKVLLKLGWSDAKYIDASQRVKDELYRSKLMCAMVQYYNCPVIYPYVWSEFQRIGPGKTRSIGYWYDDVVSQFTMIEVNVKPKIRSSTRAHMERVFGHTTSQQLNFENDLKLDLSSYFNVPHNFVEYASLHLLPIFKTDKTSFAQCAKQFYPIAVPKTWLY